MRRIGFLSVHVSMALWLSAWPLLGAEQPVPPNCDCEANPPRVQAACDELPEPACDAPGSDAPECDSACDAPAQESLACIAPGCGVSNCDSGICEAVSAACDAPDCGCCDCFQCCNGWSVLAEAVFLRRSDSGSVPLIFDQNTGETLLNANNLEFNHQAVPRVQLIREYCCCWGWDIGYFGTDGWSTSRSRGGERSPVLVGPGFEFGSTALGTVFQFDYSTELQSGEVNLRRRCHDCLTLVAGFRWIELSDELQAYSTAPSLTSYYSVDADNHLYGFQIGADAVLLQPTAGFHIDTIVRVGVLGNNADQTTRAPVLADFNGFVDQVGASGDETSFMAELGVRGVFQLSNSWSVFGGYQALWLDGLALAPEQIPVTNLSAPGSAALNTDGELFFHGATVGLQVAF